MRNLFRLSGTLRPITKAELSPTPSSAAVCQPVKGGKCINTPKFILDPSKRAFCGVHARQQEPHHA